MKFLWTLRVNCCFQSVPFTYKFMTQPKRPVTHEQFFWEKLNAVWWEINFLLRKKNSKQKANVCPVEKKKISISFHWNLFYLICQSCGFWILTRRKFNMNTQKCSFFLLNKFTENYPNKSTLTLKSVRRNHWCGIKMTKKYFLKNRHVICRFYGFEII